MTPPVQTDRLAHLDGPEPVDIASVSDRMTNGCDLSEELDDRDAMVAVLAYLRERALADDADATPIRWSATGWRGEVIRLTGGAS